MLMRIIFLCHDLTRVVTENDSFLTGASQDELILVQHFTEQGAGKFIEKNSDEMKIEISGQSEVWLDLKYFEFNSERKLMTRVVQNKDTG